MNGVAGNLPASGRRSMARVYLHKGRTKRIEAGHPWVYRTEIDRVDGSFRPGDTVDVLDHRGRFIGRGYINPASMITVRILTRADEEICPEFFGRRISAAWEFRRRVVDDPGCDSCRVVFAESDFLPGLVVDKFADCVVVQTLTLGIDRWKDAIVESLDETVRPRGIYERNDAAVRELEGLERRKGWLKGDLEPMVVIRENGIRLYVDISAGQKTGYFLDQRENRAAIEKYAAGARVLDCFCYTGSFSLHAARCGASQVIGIDISHEAVELARKNAALNGYLDVCSFRAGNAFDELRALDRSRQVFDLVILDPPAFAKNRRALESALRGYKEINLRAIRLLREGGFLVTSSCSHPVSESLFLDVVCEAATDAGRTLRLVEFGRQARDHPILVGYDESRYLKCLIFQVL